MEGRGEGRIAEVWAFRKEAVRFHACGNSELELEPFLKV